MTLYPQDARPDIVGIAAEVGRLESKGEFSLGNPFGAPDLGFLDDLLRKIGDLLGETGGQDYPGGVWTARDACGIRDPLDVGEVAIGVAATTSFEAAVMARFTALAQLLQASKSRSGPVCKEPAATGRSVTVHFRSDDPSPRSENYLRKQLSYRLRRGPADRLSTTHWRMAASTATRSASGLFVF